MMNPDITMVKGAFVALQEQLCQSLEKADGKALFHSDVWVRDAGGGGDSRVLDHGGVFEQAGVNFSHITGDALPAASTQARPELHGCQFEALGVSLVVHPENPFVPTAHMNVRFFIAKKAAETIAWWFGGGFDLTPYYGFEEDCIHWHQVAKEVCTPLGPDKYNEYKAWCDRYFYLPHRDEPRGIGGLFFDDLNEEGFEASFAFTRSVGEGFIQAYMPIVERRQSRPYSETQKDFQLYRRGRYVEFNLVHDRGTLFGLQSGGRTESILMSMPPLVKWRYNWQPIPDSPEARLYQEFLKPRDWLATN